MGTAASEDELSARGVPKTPCGAKTKSGGRCRRVAGFGTEHLGFGNCNLHGGATPNGQVHGARMLAAALALEYECEPHDALLRAVGQAAKWELVCRLKAAGLSDDQLVVRKQAEKRLERETDADDDVAAGEGARQLVTLVEVRSSNEARLNVWVNAHIQSIRDLASISKTAIDAGVEERRVRVAEALGGQLADVLGAIFTELELTAEQRKAAQPVVRRHLELLEGGSAA